jgi:large conductance mechanosensitive channel
VPASFIFARHPSGDTVLNEFKAFISRGNVLDLAVGVIIGAAFGKIVNTLVEGILMPPFGLVLGNVDFSSLFYVLGNPAKMPASLAEAKADGVPVIAYGAFINDVIYFLIIALAVFLLVKQVSKLTSRFDKPVAVTTRECPYCYSNIPLKATRCLACTSQVNAA